MAHFKLFVNFWFVNGVNSHEENATIYFWSVSVLSSRAGVLQSGSALVLSRFQLSWVWKDLTIKDLNRALKDLNLQHWLTEIMNVDHSPEALE